MANLQAARKGQPVVGRDEFGSEEGRPRLCIGPSVKKPFSGRL
ncbi:hypothetical protein [Lunatibacter salilacus]|nr:hypothetical protein [Lunatibacter salilacus]